MKKCLFCGVLTRCTKEHPFPKWLKTVIPRGPSRSHQILTFRIDDGRRSWIKPERRSHGRNIGDTQLPIVCAACNNGWMSRLQTAVKPIQIPLIKGETVTLSVEQQQVLAAWTMMTSMVAEFMDPSPQSRMVKPEERRELRDLMTASLAVNHDALDNRHRALFGHDARSHCLCPFRF